LESAPALASELVRATVSVWVQVWASESELAEVLVRALALVRAWVLESAPASASESELVLATEMASAYPSVLASVSELVTASV
jgi:hypothetical protein